MELISFSAALEILKDGGRVARTGWNGAGQWIELQRPDGRSKMSLPYLYISTITGAKVPWLASQTDLLAEDWFVLRASAAPDEDFDAA